MHRSIASYGCMYIYIYVFIYSTSTRPEIDSYIYIQVALLEGSSTRERSEVVHGPAVTVAVERETAGVGRGRGEPQWSNYV